MVARGPEGSVLAIKDALLLLLFMSASRYASLSAILARFACYFPAVTVAGKVFPLPGFRGSGEHFILFKCIDGQMCKRGYRNKRYTSPGVPHSFIRFWGLTTTSTLFLRSFHTVLHSTLSYTLSTIFLFCF